MSVTPDLLYSEEEDALRSAIRDLLTDQCDAASVLARCESDAAHDRELWKALTEGMGLAGLLVPERLGGQGATHREAAVVLEELGRAMAPVPYLTSAVIATEALLGCASRGSAEAAAVLSALATGRTVAALAVPLSTAPGAAHPVIRNENGTLHGRIPAVADATAADVLLVPTDTGLQVVDTSEDPVTITPRTSLDRTRPVADVTLTGARGRTLEDDPGAAAEGAAGTGAAGMGSTGTPAADAVGAGSDSVIMDADASTACDAGTADVIGAGAGAGAGAGGAVVGGAGAAGAVGPDAYVADAAGPVLRALHAGAGLLASEQLGLAEWCLAETVRHLRERRQFNRPVGSFQALKHRLAQLWLETVHARAAARNAADALATDSDRTPLAVALAQSYTSGVAVHAAEEAVQLHGGIGMTWEHPLHLYLKRAKADSIALGTAGRHRGQLTVLADLAAP